MKRQFEFVREPKGSDLERLLVALSSYAASASLVVRDSLEVSDKGEAVLRALESHQVEVSEGSEWPGTRLLVGRARIYRYRFSVLVAQELSKLSSGLFDWLQPDRPEDLALYREDGTTLLATIAHEREAFVALSESEEEDLSRMVPAWRELASPSE